MAVTPRWVMGCEFRGPTNATCPEFEVYEGDAPVTSSISSFTGSYAIIPTSNITRVWGSKTFPASTHMRMGYYYHHEGLTGSGASVVDLFGAFRASPLGSTIFGLARKGDTDEIIPVINGTPQTPLGDLAAMGIVSLDTWYHIGLLCEVGNPGYAAVFVGGRLVWDYDGEITGTMTCAVFQSAPANRLDSSARFDDIYADDIAGEVNAAPPAYRFAHRIANAAGADNVWDSTEANNYEAVDDNGHDGDTTYNYSDTDAERDTFNATDMAEFAGHSIILAHPCAVARRTGTKGQIKLHTYDGANYLTGTAQDLAIDYSFYFDTQTTMPDGTTAFSTEAAINGTQIGYESDGFS